MSSTPPPPASPLIPSGAKPSKATKLRDFDWSRDRKLQIMIKLNGGVIVDPRTPSLTGVGARVGPKPGHSRSQSYAGSVTPGAANKSLLTSPQAHSLSLSAHLANNNNNNAGYGGNNNNNGRDADVMSNVSLGALSAATTSKNVSDKSKNGHNNNNNGNGAIVNTNLAHYCIYIKWSTGRFGHSGKFPPLCLGSALTREDGRIEFVFPAANVDYEVTVPVDFGSSSTMETKKIAFSCYILTFTKNPMDPLLSAEKRMKFFRTEDDAGRVLRQKLVEGHNETLNKWLTLAKPGTRRQHRLDIARLDTLVLDYSVLRDDDILPHSVQVLPFDGAATATSPNNSNNIRKASPTTTNGAAAPATIGMPPLLKTDATATSSTNNNNGTLPHNKYSSFHGDPQQQDSEGVEQEDDVVHAEPDLRPGIPISSRVDIFNSLSATLSKAAEDSKLSVGLTGLMSIFETGNSASLKLPGLSAAAAFSILLSNDSPFLSTFHEKRKDKGYMHSPWKENLLKDEKSQQNFPKNNSLRMRYSGYEMRFGGHYVEIREHSFALAYRLPSDSRGNANYIGQFHLQPTGMASAARVELAIHIGNGLMSSITSESSVESPPLSDDGTPLPCCTVHFAMAVTFSSAHIEGRFRSKADSMIPKMLNALSTTARALLGADDLSKQAQDAAATAAGKAFLKRNDARVAMNPLMALRPYQMKSNACIAQHFLKMAVNSPSPMRPRPANLELIATLLTMHLKHEPIVRLAMEVLDRCIGAHGRGVATYCPGLSDAVERARMMYSLPFLEGGLTPLDHTVEQLLNRQVHEDIKTVGVWKVLQGKSKISSAAGSESSFFMGDIHRVRVTLRDLKDEFAPKAGVKVQVQLDPEQVNVLVALLSLHLNEEPVVEAVTFALERTSSHCLVSSVSLAFIVDSVYTIYPKYRPRLEALREGFQKLRLNRNNTPGKQVTSRFGAALHDGDPIFQTKITLYEPVDEGECELVLTRKSFYLGSIAFPLEHLYTIARTKVYWFLPAIRIVSQKPKATVTTGKKDFAPLRDDHDGWDDEEDEFSLLESNLMLDNAFKDLDMSVAANLGVGLGASYDLLDSSSNNNDSLLVSGSPATSKSKNKRKNAGEDEELSSNTGAGGSSNHHHDTSAPFMTRSTLEPGDHSHHLEHTKNNKNGNGNDDDDETNKNHDVKKVLPVAVDLGGKDVAVTFLAKCWNIDELFEALRKIGYSGRITTE